MNSPAASQGIIFFMVMCAPIGLILLSVRRGPMSRLRGAFLLILWGLFIAFAEHAGFGRTRFGGPNLTTHEGFHYQMLAAYGLAAFALTAVVIAPLIRRGDKVGWYGLLVLFIIGLSAEILTAAITTPHGVSPRWWSWGLALWVYPLAWAAALVLSWRPMFRPEPLSDVAG